MIQKIPTAAIIFLFQFVSVRAQYIAASKNKYWYSEEIAINFDVADIDDENKTSYYIGLYDEFPEDGYYNYDHQSALWSGICGTQESYYTGCDGIEPTKGQVKFYARDPSHDSSSEFPLHPGTYYACLWTFDYYHMGDCTEFEVKALPNIVLDKATIGPVKANLKTMTLSVNWATPIPIVKQWIGIFPVDEIVNGILPYNSTKSTWLYTGCNNQNGDQNDNNDCSVRKTSGVVHFNVGNIDRYGDDIWPPLEGTYRLCLVVQYEPPHTSNVYKCMSKTLKVPNLERFQ